MYSHQEESIFIRIDENTYEEMANEGLLWPQIETGGMLFGNLIEEDNNLIIEILKTYIPSDENCIRKSAYFEIDPDYAKTILAQEDLQYLGNWHKHPGYGGPSHGDHGQIYDFFINNPHLDTVLTFIINFYSEKDYEPIIEVYFRRNESNSENNLFVTRGISQKNLEFINDDLMEDGPLIKEKGIPLNILTGIKTELLRLFDHLTSLNDIKEFPGQLPNEKVLSFPYPFEIKTINQLKKFNLLILMSFPPEFPKGKIYFDISSEDMSKNITFKTHPAETLNDDELIQPFLLLLKSDIEDDIPLLLEKPLWQVMQEKK
ncbi:MAG: hypothetical protein ACXABG_14030 [Promethearchaeota archaeon]